METRWEEYKRQGCCREAPAALTVRRQAREGVSEKTEIPGGDGHRYGPEGECAYLLVNVMSTLD